MEKMIIRSVRNEHGVKVKRCCASCLHKEITNERCKQWQMSEGLINAGMSMGVVRDKDTKEIIIR